MNPATNAIDCKFNLTQTALSLYTITMGKHDNQKNRPNYDDLDDEIFRDEIDKIFREHPRDYISKLEQIGFTYYDDEPDQEEQEEAIAKPINSNQEYLVSYFNGKIPLSDETIEIFLEERRSPKPNFPLIRRHFKEANKYLLSLLLHGLHRYQVSEELLSDLAYFHEYQNIMSLLVDYYSIACEKQENLQVFSELVQDFYYAVDPDGFDVFHALRERYPVGTDKRKVIDFIDEMEDTHQREEDYH